MTRADQHYSYLLSRHGRLAASFCCAAIAVAALAGRAAAQPIIIGGSGKPAIEINRGAGGAMAPSDGATGEALLHPGRQPSKGQIGRLRPPGGGPAAEPPPRPSTTAPRPPLLRPPVPAAAPAPAPARAATAPPPAPPPVPAPAMAAAPPPPAASPPPVTRPAPMPVPPAAAAPPARIPAPAPQAALPTAAPRQPARPEAPLAMQPGEDGPTFALNFEPGGAELSEAAKSQISQLAAKVKSEGGRLQLKAFASAAGGGGQARRTSLSRALAVRSYFIQEGLRSSVIDVRALGEPKDGGREDRVDVILLER